MKVTILGAGTGVSQVPVQANREPPGFLLEWGDQKLLFECSEGMRFRLERMGYDYALIDHIAISHSHSDHCVLTPFFLALFLKGVVAGDPYKDRTVNIYCPPELARNYPHDWQFHFPDWQGKPLPWPKIVFKAMPPADADFYGIGDARLSARKVYHAHGRVEAIAFRLETPEGVVVYSGDTGDCPGIREISAGADLFICESSAPIKDATAPTGYGHLNPQTAADIAVKAKAKRLALFHYYGVDTDDAIIRECRRAGYQGELILGKDFQVIQV